MSAISLHAYAEQILCLSHEMYRYAKDGEWSMFSGLEASRQEMIERLFSHPQLESRLQQLSETLMQVVVIDKKSMRLGESEKHRLVQEMTGKKQHQQAARVYQQVSIN